VASPVHYSLPNFIPKHTEWYYDKIGHLDGTLAVVLINSIKNCDCWWSNIL